MLTVKANRKHLKAIEDYYKDYPWPLFTKEFLIYEYRGTVPLWDDKVVDVYVDVSLEDFSANDIRLYIRKGSSSVKVKTPFWWKWKFKRTLLRSMKKASKEELKAFIE